MKRGDEVNKRIRWVPPPPARRYKIIKLKKGFNITDIHGGGSSCGKKTKNPTNY